MLIYRIRNTVLLFLRLLDSVDCFVPTLCTLTLSIKVNQLSISLSAVIRNYKSIFHSFVKKRDLQRLVIFRLILNNWLVLIKNVFEVLIDFVCDRRAICNHRLWTWFPLLLLLSSDYIKTLFHFFFVLSMNIYLQIYGTLYSTIQAKYTKQL